MNSQQLNVTVCGSSAIEIKLSWDLQKKKKKISIEKVNCKTAR
jgi:hypothetical protein